MSSICNLSQEDMYTLPIGERWMLFSPYNMSSAMVNNAAVKYIAACLNDSKVAVPESVRNLYRLLTKGPISNHAPEGFEKLVIIPTRSCNMRCAYCDFAANRTHYNTLDPILGCRLIDDTVEKLSLKSSSILRVHFFGGEPLAARQCVETIVHYTRMVCSKRRLTPWFEITTNGFFDSTAIPFIGDYIDSVVISIDGDEALHDFNRRRKDGKGTYIAIAENIRRLGKFPVDISLRTCVTNRSVDSMPDIVSHFCSEFDFDQLCFEMMTPNEISQNAGLDPPDPYRFAAGVLKAESMADLHDIRIVQGPSELIGPRTTSCPVGRGTLMLTPEGALTVCYLETERWTSHGIDPVVGRVDLTSGAIIEDKKFNLVDSFLKSKPRCERCFCRYTCAGGCHIDQTPAGCSSDYDNRCLATRIITAGRLLRKLEGAEAVASFVDLPSAMRAVAENADDHILKWPSDSSNRME